MRANATRAWRRGFWEPAVLLPAIFVLLSGLTSPLHGSHLFRQAHVAANIETYVADGISLHPRTYNADVPFILYDFPIYQILVAGVCRLFATDPLVTARLLSALCFLLSLAILRELMVRTGIPRGPRILALVFFAYAPLNLFYYQTPLVDTLNASAALLSLAAFCAWRQGGGAGAWGLMAASGVAAALIKSPGELPAATATAWSRARTAGWRSLLHPSLAGYLGLLGGAVLAVKLYGNSVNGIDVLLTPWEEGQYFGSPAQRLDFNSWWPVLETLGSLVLNPITSVLALGGTGAWLLRSRSRERSVYAGFLLGGGLTIVVFLNRFRVHNYYALPLAFPAAFFAAHGAQQCRVLARAWRRQGRGWAVPCAEGLVVLCLAATAVFAGRGYDALSRTDPSKQARGEWVRDRSSPGDFVIWVVGGDEDNWNPAFLYFAKRNGINLNRTRLARSSLRSIYEGYAGRYRRVLLFCADRETGERIESLGGSPLAVEKARRLYRVDATWLTDRAGPS